MITRYTVKHNSPEKLSTMEDHISLIPNSEREAMQWLIPALDRPLKEMADDDFRKAWFAISYLYGGLNPDEASNHGDEICNDHDGPFRFQLIEPRLVNPYYKNSGWPVVLAPLADEAWERHENGRLEEYELYCCEVVRIGILDRMAGETGLLSTSLKS